jgi:hypothetical protein
MYLLLMNAALLAVVGAFLTNSVPPEIGLNLATLGGVTTLITGVKTVNVVILHHTMDLPLVCGEPTPAVV